MFICIGELLLGERMQKQEESPKKRSYLVRMLIFLGILFSLQQYITHPKKSVMLSEKGQNKENFSQLREQQGASKENQLQRGFISHISQTIKNQFERESAEESNDQSQSDSSSLSYEEDILEKHETALHLNIKKHNTLLEVLLRFKLKAFPNQQYFRNTVKILSFYPHLQVILENIKINRPDKAKAFNEFLSKSDNLYRFLLHIHTSYQNYISDELLKMVFLIWEYYCPFSKTLLSQEEISNLSSFISARLYWNKAIFSLPRTFDETNEVESSIKSLISFFTETVLLVMEKYFLNPYVRKRSQEAKKRQKPKDDLCQSLEEKLGMVRKKKIKLEC